jgi:dipeptidyl aminopeptidase/acylaminoacyl peptidase
VPPPQSEAIVEAVKQRDGDIEYIVFEGEGHGFRKAESLKKALESELAFYERVLKLKA